MPRNNKKRDDEQQMVANITKQTRVPELRREAPTAAYSDKSLAALKSGNYKDFRESGMRAYNYQQNLAKEQKKYSYNEQAAKNNTLEKADKDFGIKSFGLESSDHDYLQRIYDRFGDSDLTRRTLRESNQTKDWERKYGKSYDQIYKDFLADQGNVKMEMGEAHPILTELGTIANSVPTALSALPSLTANLINPESETAKNLEQIRAKKSEENKYWRAGVKENTGEKGDKAIDMLNSIADRMAVTTAGKVAGTAIGGGKLGDVLGSTMAGLSEANQRLDDLDVRGVDGRQKYLTALGHGAVEGAGTALVGGWLDRIPGAKNLKGAAWNLIKGGIEGGAENAGAEVLHNTLDTLINKENSQKELNKAIFMAQGMSEQDAEDAAQNEQLKQVGAAALTGAGFGIGQRGVSVGLKKALPNLFDPDYGKVDTQTIYEPDENAKAPTSADLPKNSVEQPKAEIPDQAKVDVPEQPKGLQGEEFDKAKAEYDANKKAISDLRKENKTLKSLKQTKENKAKVADNNARIKELQRKNVLLDRDMYGKPTPVIEQLDSGTVENLNNLKRQIKDAGNMFAGENGKTLAEEANAALDRYIESGNVDDYIDFTNKVQALEDASRGNTYTVKTGKNKGQVRTFEENYPDGSLMSLIKSREGYLEGETHDPTFKALEDVFDFHKQKNSAPAEPDVPTVKPTDVSQQEVPNVSQNEYRMPTQDTVPALGEEKVRSFSKRGAADESFPEEVRQSLSEDMYRVVRNADVEERANSLFDPNDLTQTRSNFDNAVEHLDPAAVPLSYKLAKAYADSGQYDAAIDVVEKASEGLTRGGQFTQVAKLAMLQNDPMAAMRAYIRDLDKLNEWGSKKYKKKWTNLELSQDDVDLFNSVQKGDSDMLNAVVDYLNKQFGKKIPANWWDKVVGATKTSMLLNTRTQVRNIGANTAMLPVRSLSDRVSAVGQNIAHLINPDIKVTQSLTGGTAEQKAVAEQLFDQFKDSILNENKMKDSVQSDILSNRQIFNNDFFAKWVDNATDGGVQRLNERLGSTGNQSTMETLQNFTYWLMGDFGDTPFVKKNFVNRLASYMKAQGINNIEDVPDDAIAIATQEALKATFKDDNAFTKALQGTKSKWGKFGEVALPFVKTPANLAMRSIDYSPAGLINTFRKIKSGADASAVIDELSKNLTGSALIYLGYKLRDSGLLSGNYSEDKDEKAFQKQQGMLENAIKVGGNYYSIDWMQPACTPLILGSVVYDAINKSDEENNDLLSVLNSTWRGGLKVADSWLETSPVKSLSDMLGNNPYNSDGGVAENVAQEIIEFPQRLFPAQIGAMARTVDPVIRDTYSKDDSLTGILGNEARSLVAKVPYLSKMLPASYDTWGNERTRSDSTAGAFFAQNLNPGQLGNKNETPIDDEIQRLFNETGNNGVFPLSAARSLQMGGETVKLSNKEHSEYQRIMGEQSYEMASALINSPEYQSMSDDAKAETLKKIYDLSNALAKEKLFNHTTDTDKKLKEIYKTQGANGVVDYFMTKAKADSLGMSVDTYTKKEEEEPGSAAQWAQDKESALNNGFVNKDGNANVEAYEKAVSIVGNDQNALNSYRAYQQQDFTKDGEKIPYLMNTDEFTDEQKGMLLKGTNVDSLKAGARGAYDIGGWADVYYYYLIRNLADQAGDRSGKTSKKELQGFLQSGDPYLQYLSDEMTAYLMGYK